jgi:cupin fold WbuC family metalloprotein
MSLTSAAVRAVASSAACSIQFCSAMRSPVQVIEASAFSALVEEARRSPRLRTNFNYHGSPEDNPQRFLNILVEGTYIRPHRHLNPPKSESFLILEGELALLTFDDSGRVLTTTVLGRKMVLGVDIIPGTWHTLAVLSPHAVIFEVKPGPYQAITDKDFAPWAPPEGHPEVASYVAKLTEAVKQG